MQGLGPLTSIRIHHTQAPARRGLAIITFPGFQDAAAFVNLSQCILAGATRLVGEGGKVDGPESCIRSTLEDAEPLGGGLIQAWRESGGELLVEIPRDLKVYSEFR